MWYVQRWCRRRDLYASEELWRSCFGDRWGLSAGALAAVLGVEGAGVFVVRGDGDGEGAEGQEGLLGMAITFRTEVDAGGRPGCVGSLAVVCVREEFRCVLFSIIIIYSTHSIHPTIRFFSPPRL